jgi:biotin operon repressor
MECRVNTDEKNDNYMLVYASQQQIADELGFTREWISHCINRMSEKESCIFTKVRQGLNKANYYIMQKKKEMVDLLKQIFKAQQEEAKAKNSEKQDNQKKEYKKYSKKESTFNDFDQRDYVEEYGSFDELEKKLIGLG